MKDNTKYLPLAGRVLIGGIFMMSGLSKLGSYGGTTATISSVGLPFAPLGFVVAIAVEIGVAFLLLIGYHARPAALALAIWCVVLAIFFHRNFADQNMFIHFLKNLMIAGGLLQIVHFGAGALSVDNRQSARGGMIGLQQIQPLGSADPGWLKHLNREERIARVRARWTLTARRIDGFTTIADHVVRFANH